MEVDVARLKIERRQMVARERAESVSRLSVRRRPRRNSSKCAAVLAILARARA
jgi:hypothetical protein